MNLHTYALADRLPECPVAFKIGRTVMDSLMVFATIVFIFRTCAQGAHSFRKAVWDWAVANGVTDSAIQLLYEWESDAINKYKCVLITYRTLVKYNRTALVCVRHCAHVTEWQRVFHARGSIPSLLVAER